MINDGSDNYDCNFGTSDVVLKIIRKYKHNMILMSRYKGQLHGGKRVNKFWQGPPLFGECPKENIPFLHEVFPYNKHIYLYIIQSQKRRSLTSERITTFHRSASATSAPLC